jgi:hypothetical protein
MELSAGVGDGVNPAVVHPRGFVPLQLSRDGREFFYTANFFYYYETIHNYNFSAIYPGGGPDNQPTSVTIMGEGMLGFDGDASNCRCRWGGTDNADDVTTPTQVTSTSMVCLSYDRQLTPGTIELCARLPVPTITFKPIHSSHQALSSCARHAAHT